MTRTVTISGKRLELDSAEVERAAARVLPEPVREHFVVIGGRRYPPKQVISLVTGLDRADFTTHQARRVLMRLGFPAARRTGSPGVGGQATGRAATGSGREDDPLRPFIGKWVAVSGDEVLVAADDASQVVSWLAKHGHTAESMFRVSDEEPATTGAAPA